MSCFEHHSWWERNNNDQWSRTGQGEKTESIWFILSRKAKSTRDIFFKGEKAAADKGINCPLCLWEIGWEAISLVAGRETKLKYYEITLLVKVVKHDDKWHWLVLNLLHWNFSEQFRQRLVWASAMKLEEILRNHLISGSLFYYEINEHAQWLRWLHENADTTGKFRNSITQLNCLFRKWLLKNGSCERKWSGFLN